MSFTTLALPASDRGWFLCSGGKEVAHDPDLRELAGKRADLLVAIPAANLSTFLVTLPPVEEALLASMLHAQVDKRGLTGKVSTLIDYARLGSDEEGEVWAVRVVPDLPADLIVPTAAGYTLSAELHSPATGTATVWREFGRLVFSVRINGVLAHVQVLSGKPEVGPELARELNLILLGLKGQRSFENAGPMELVLSLDSVGRGEMEAFRSILSIPVREERPAHPVKGEEHPRLLPVEVTRQRRRRRDALRNVAIGAAALVLYTVAGIWIWNEAKATEGEIASLERRIAIIQPDVERVQLAGQRWRALEPAFEKDLFPVVQLSRITSALPGSGVVVREYRTTGRNIRIRGQARDVQLANRLLEDLKGLEDFARYEWSMPNPRVERNNTATFEIQGKIKNEGTDG